MKLLSLLDQKIEFVSQKMDMIKATNHDHSQNNGGVLVPYFEPTPMSNLMISSRNNVDYTNMDVFNQLPMFNYPINNNNNHHYHQILPSSSDAFQFDRIFGRSWRN